MNVLPCPGVEATRIIPPCRVTNRSTQRQTESRALLAQVRTFGDLLKLPKNARQISEWDPDAVSATLTSELPRR